MRTVNQHSTVIRRVKWFVCFISVVYLSASWARWTQARAAFYWSLSYKEYHTSRKKWCMYYVLSYYKVLSMRRRIMGFVVVQLFSHKSTPTRSVSYPINPQSMSMELCVLRFIFKSHLHHSRPHTLMSHPINPQNRGMELWVLLFFLPGHICTPHLH